MFARVAFLSSILFIAGTAGSAHANSVESALQAQLTPTAKVMVEFMKNNSPPMKTVSFMEFQAPPGPESAYALGMRQNLITCVKNEAKKADYEIQVVDVGGNLQVYADMFYATDIKDHQGNRQLAAIRVEFRLRDAGGRQVKVPVQIKEAAAVNDGIVIGSPALTAAALGLTMLLLSGNQADAQKELDKLRNGQPTFRISDDGKLLKAEAGSPYSVEIKVVSKAGSPKKAQDWANMPTRPLGKTKDGKSPFLEVDDGEVYAIRVHNESDYDAAVDVRIDGLSVFHFVDDKYRVGGQPKYQYYIVPRKDKDKGVGIGLIPGWYRDEKKSLAFLVRDFGEAQYNGFKAPKEKTPGIISITISGAWNEGDTPPEKITGGRNIGKKETDTGPEIEWAPKEVKKIIGKPTTVISIHYNH